MYEDVTRFEVINESGRVLVKYGIHIQADLQDEGRTLKIFMYEKNKDLTEKE